MTLFKQDCSFVRLGQSYSRDQVGAPYRESGIDISSQRFVANAPRSLNCLIWYFFV
jgi:hypothetical protein